MARKPQHSPSSSPRHFGRGFTAVSGLVDRQIRHSGEKRGFAVMRLLTRWSEIVGPDTAKIATPVKVSYAQHGLGATLTILTSGAQAPMLQAQLPRLKDKVNAVYGYNAISRIKITQTAPTGFREGQLHFEAAPSLPRQRIPAEIERASRETVGDVGDTDLKHALEKLGANVLNKSRSPERS